MIEGREICCDVCDRPWASVPPGALPPAYTPLDFCPACAVRAVTLIQVWGALPDGEAAALASKMVALVDGGPYPAAEKDQLSATLRNLSAHMNSHLRDAVRNGVYSARELYLKELPAPAVDWVLSLIDSAGWSLTLRLAELAPFLARLEPDERRRLDYGLQQCRNLVKDGDPGASVDACARATHALMEAVFRAVVFTFASEPGTWLEEEHWIGDDHLAAEFGITKSTMHSILEAMQAHGLAAGR